MKDKECRCYSPFDPSAKYTTGYQYSYLPRQLPRRMEKLRLQRGREIVPTMGYE